MKRTLTYLTAFLAFMVIAKGNKCYAQQAKAIKAKIAVLARPYKDSVLLRWAPENSEAWQLLNKEGYIIKRLTLTINGKLNPAPRYKVLTPHSIKPLPLPQWESFVNADHKYGTVAAEALYGESFSVTQDMKGDVGQMINLLQQNEQRFSVALLCADQSYYVAKAMGLAFTDTAVKPNEKYLYQVFAAQSKRLIDSGTVVTSYASRPVLPKPTGLEAEINEEGVKISWDYKPFGKFYTYYRLERSVDGGKTFVNTRDMPVVNPEEELIKTGKAYQLDSVSPVNKVLVYRVKGVTPFGESGPPSDTISVTTFNKLKTAPVVVKAEVLSGTVKIDWMMPVTKAMVLGFDVERSDNPKKGYIKLNKQLLPPETVSFTDLQPNSINFYRITAKGRGKVSTHSYYKMVEMPDSIPPAPPADITGEISKEGIVKLKWKANAEPDVFGYRVFRSNTEKGEFVQITKTASLVNNYTDTIQLQTLTKYVFYKLVAIDKHYNPSAFSDVLRLKRPDIVPPSAPTIASIKSLTTGVFLSWFNSSSDDVIKHEILRTPEGQQNWQVLKIFTDTTQRFIDETAVLKQPYAYKIRALDESGLTGESRALVSQRLDLGLKPEITTFNGAPDRENQQIILKWSYKQPGVKKYVLYRAETGKPLRLYKTIEGKLTAFTDAELFINTEYQYRIKALFADGEETRLSKEIIVNY